jgi:hypothetical protein
VTDVTAAVVPVAAKSLAATPVTASLKVARNVRLSALVVARVGTERIIDVSRGAMVSIVVVQPNDVPLEFVFPLTTTDALAVIT